MNEKERNLGYRSHHEWLTEGKESVVDEIYAPDCELINANVPEELKKGREAFKAYGRYLRAAFPDIKITNDMTVAGDNELLILWSMTGTNKGSFFGLPPTNKPISITGSDLMIIDKNGQVAQLYLEQDIMNLLAQMGVIPS